MIICWYLNSLKLSNCHPKLLHSAHTMAKFNGPACDKKGKYRYVNDNLESLIVELFMWIFLVMLMEFSIIVLSEVRKCFKCEGVVLNPIVRVCCDFFLIIEVVFGTLCVLDICY